MNTVTVEIAGGEEAVRRAETLLQNIPGGLEAAVRDAAGKAARKVQTASVAAIQEQFDITAENIRANRAIKASVRRENGGVQAVVKFSGKRIPLHRFGGASPAWPSQNVAMGKLPVLVNGSGIGKGVWSSQYPGVQAKGHQYKSTQPVPLSRDGLDAFVARMSKSSGHVGIFARTGNATAYGGDQITELMGDSVPQMLGHETAAKALTEEAYAAFEQNLDAAVYRILHAAGAEGGGL